jgi:hypothetical protein
MQLEFWTLIPTISHLSIIPIGHFFVIQIHEVKTFNISQKQVTYEQGITKLSQNKIMPPYYLPKRYILF